MATATTALRTALGRLARLLGVLLIVTAGTFALTEVAPGDPAVAVLGPSATPEEYDRVEAELGLDEPILARYASWLGGAVQGDLGNTLVPPVTPVTELIGARLVVTVELALLAMVLAVAIAVPLGTWSAYRAGTAGDTAASAVAFATVSVPPFLAALGLAYFLVLERDVGLDGISVGGPLLAALLGGAAVARTVRARHRDLRGLAVRLAAAGALALATATIARWFPDLPRQGLVRLSSGEGLGAHLRSLALPVLALGLVEGAILSRVLRTDVISVLQEDFVTTARAKGVSDLRILVRHTLRPASLSLVTMAGISLGRLLGGTVIVETIFRLPGMGSLMVDAISDKDIRVVQAGVLTVSVLYVAINAAVDAGYRFLDPRAAA